MRRILIVSAGSSVALADWRREGETVLRQALAPPGREVHAVQLPRDIDDDRSFCARVVAGGGLLFHRDRWLGRQPAYLRPFLSAFPLRLTSALGLRLVRVNGVGHLM